MSLQEEPPLLRFPKPESAPDHSERVVLGSSALQKMQHYGVSTREDVSRLLQVRWADLDDADAEPAVIPLSADIADTEMTENKSEHGAESILKYRNLEVVAMRDVTYIVMNAKTWEELTLEEVADFERVIERPGRKVVLCPKLYPRETMENFLRHPRYRNSIAGDGYVIGVDHGQDHDMELAYLSEDGTDARDDSDHHGNGSNRFRDRAHCRQGRDKIARGTYERFFPDVRLYYIGIDEDVIAFLMALSRYYDLKKEEIAGRRSVPAEREFADGGSEFEWIDLEGYMDQFGGGAYQLTDVQRRKLKTIFAPFQVIKESGKCDAFIVAEVVEECLQNLEAVRSPNAELLELEERYHVMDAGPGMAMIDQAEPDARPRLRRDLKQEGKETVIFTNGVTSEGKWLYSFMFWQEVDDVDPEDMYRYVNLAEELRMQYPLMSVTAILQYLRNHRSAEPTYKPCGGCKAGGNYPEGSYFSKQEFFQLVRGIMPMAKEDRMNKVRLTITDGI